MNTQQPELLSAHDLSMEIEDTHRALFRALAPGMFILAWIWLYYALTRDLDPFVSALPFLVVAIGAYVGYRIAERRLVLASFLLLGALICAGALLTAAHPFSLAAVSGVVVIVIANALVPGMRASLVAFLTWGSMTFALYSATAGTWWRGQSIQLGIAYAVILGAAWLTTRPARRSVEMALDGWAHARNAMLQMRQQRGELYRTVRLLEEANYRIVRANHDLSVAQREAEAAREHKARFAATVSHELRGPLNLILGYSRLMCLSPESYAEPLPSAYRADMYTIYRSCQHLLALVDDILDLSQMDMAQLPLVKDRVDLDAEVCRRSLDLVRPLAERKGLALEYEVAGPLPWVLADAVRLRQALLNILTNAVRFTERGSISVRVRRSDGSIEILVTDTGPGIPPEDIPKLFREFSQVHPQPTEGDSGSGLGLAITRHLIELHGGEIWVESQVGQGTTFGMSVPLPEAATPVAGTVRTSSVEHRYTAPVCIVVHDDPDIIRLLARQMSEYHITGLPHETDLPALVSQLEARAVLTTPDRLAAVMSILRESALDIPIVSCAFPSFWSRFRGSNILGYLVKPIVPEVLTATLGRLNSDQEMTVLVVDDDPEAARLIGRMINSLPSPYGVVYAYDGMEALQCMDASPPDLVLLDSVMPNVSGEQVLECMWASESLRDVPVVIVSGQDWIGPDLTVGDSIRLHNGSPIPLSQAIECIRAVLGQLPFGSPSALADCPPAIGAAPEAQASAIPPRRPERSPDRFGPAPSR